MQGKPASTHSQYRPDIDGLRALAIGSVLLFHLGVPYVSGGFVGVDIFFVISGFLITRIITSEISSSGSFDFRAFYIRRVRRLFPALAFTLLVSTLAAGLLFSIKYFDHFGLSLLSALFSVSNFFFWKNSGYFAPGSDLEPLLHTWSLSAEEQFYLFWPATLAILLKLKNSRGIALILISLFIASLGASYTFQEQKELIFYLLPFRVFEFLLGASLAWAPPLVNRGNTTYLAEFLAVIGIGLILFAVFQFSEITPFPSYNALLPSLGAALLIFAGNHSRYIGNVLSNSVLVWFGLISYSLYLIHWPLIVFYKYYSDSDTLSAIEMASLAILAIVAAALMYRWIETPYRRHPRQNTNHKAFLAGCLIIFTLLAAGALYIHKSKGVPWRDTTHIKFPHTQNGGLRYSWETTIGPDSSAKLIVYGDSHSRQYLAALEKFATDKNVQIQYIGHPACLAWPDLTNLYHGTTHESCKDMLQKLQALTQGNSTPVLISYHYTKQLVDWQGKNAVSYKQDGYFETLFAGLDRLHALIGSDRKLIVFGNVPATLLKHGYLDCISRPISKLECHTSFPEEDGEMHSLRAALNHYQATRKNVLFIDPYNALCDGKSCFITRDGLLYYSDHAHLTVDGATRVINSHAEIIFQHIKPNTQVQQ